MAEGSCTRLGALPYVLSPRFILNNSEQSAVAALVDDEVKVQKCQLA